MLARRKRPACQRWAPARRLARPVESKENAVCGATLTTASVSATTCARPRAADRRTFSVCSTKYRSVSSSVAPLSDLARMSSMQGELTRIAAAGTHRWIPGPAGDCKAGHQIDKLAPTSPCPQPLWWTRFEKADLVEIARETGIDPEVAVRVLEEHLAKRTPVRSNPGRSTRASLFPAPTSHSTSGFPRWERPDRSLLVWEQAQWRSPLLACLRRALSEPETFSSSPSPFCCWAMES